MDLETAQTNTTAKLPILKQGEYETWRLRIKQYFQVQDYALWDVIENGNSFKPTVRTTANADGTSTSMIPGMPRLCLMPYKQDLVKIVSQLAILGENISQEDLNLKFLRSLPSEWNTYVVVWRNKSDLDTMSFDDLYNNFKIVKQEVKRTVPSNSSLSSQNMAFLSSHGITNEVNTANDQASTASTPVSTASTPDNIANLSNATVYAFLANQPNGSQLVYEDLKQIHEDDPEEMDLKWQLALLSMRARRYFRKTSKKITINGSDTAGYDKSKVECFNCHKMGHFTRECRGPRNQDNRNRNQDSSRRTVNVEETSFKAMVAIDGAGFDWSFMADEEVSTNMALMAFSDSGVYNDKTCSNTCLKIFETLKTQLDNLRIKFNKSKFNLATYKRGLESVEEQLVFYKKNEVMFYDQIVVLKRDTSFKDLKINALKSEIEKLKKEKESNHIKIDKFKNASKSLDKLIGSQISDNSRKGVGFFQQPEFEGNGPKASKNVCKDTSNEIRKTPDAPLGKKLMSEKEKQNVFPTKIESVKQQEKPARKPVKPTAITIKGKGWHVNTVHPKTTVYRARPMSCFSKLAQSTVKRPCQSRTALTNKNFNQKVNTAKEKVYTGKLKSVNTARPTTAVVNAVRENQGHPQKENQGYVDSGCSRHMTGNMSYLSDFKEFDGGYVTFGGRDRGGTITGKGTLKTSKLDFEDVYFVKELQFNIFSVSQTCDKKNSVLFTDTACFVLSPDFKLPDKSQVLLKVPRKNNMYSVDMKNMVPKESLTSLVAKATLDESPLWHRRLGHINFKTINKLVKDNLMRLELLRNRTLIKAARTMLADSKLPTTFWAEAVNTACYVQNRVIIVKPHNKTPYELFRGRTPALSFMRPFGCHVTILNTLDHLGKFDGKYDDNFFVGYSLTSKAFRVYNIRTRKVEESLHIRFLENKPIVTGDGPKWLFDIDSLTKSMNYVPVVAGTNSNDFAGSEESNGAGHTSKETEFSQDYIVMPLWKDGSMFDSSSKNSSDDEPQPSSNA
ncbi:ribonuclease H-like domain-containing protein [Tanacetum coccineum]